MRQGRAQTDWNRVWIKSHGRLCYNRAMSFALDRETIAAAAPPPERIRLLSLLIQIWVRPRRAMERVAAGPRWLWLIPLLFAVVALLARAVVAAPLLAQAQTAQLQAQMAAQAQALPQEDEALAPIEAPPTPVGVTLAPILAGGLAVILIGWALRALILQVSSLAMGGRQSFGQVYRLSAWAAFPLILRDAVQAAYMLLSRELVTGPGLSGLIDQGGTGSNGGAVNGLFALGGQAMSLPGVVLSKIDLYTLWFLALLVVAMQVGGNLKRGKAMLVVGIYALLALLPGLLAALVGGALTGF